jgi:prepilin signal peptidase PulO-like enzyme (type II secretory pathway)
LVEAATSILFGVVAGAALPFLQHVLTLTLFSTYIAIVAYDIRHTIIPDAWSALATFGALMLALLGISEANIFMVLISGPFVALPLWLLWFTSRGRVIGLDDAKLAISFGYLLGIAHGFVGLVYGFIIGGMVALFVLLPWNMYGRLYTRLVHPRRGRGQGSFTMKSEVPFGPFLVIGALLVWVCLSFQISLPLFPYIV